MKLILFKKLVPLAFDIIETIVHLTPTMVDDAVVHAALIALRSAFKNHNHLSED